AVYRNACKPVESGTWRIGRTWRAVSGDCGDYAARVDSPHRVVARIGDEDSSEVIDRDTARAVESRALTGPVDKARCAVAGIGRHIAARIDLANGVVAGVGDIDHAVCRIDRDPLRIVE